MTNSIYEEIDQMSCPKGWTHEKLVREAHVTGNLIRQSVAKTGAMIIGPAQVEHLTGLIGYLAKHAVANRAALESAVSGQE